LLAIVATAEAAKVPEITPFLITKFAETVRLGLLLLTDTTLKPVDV